MNDKAKKLLLVNSPGRLASMSAVVTMLALVANDIEAPLLEDCKESEPPLFDFNERKK